MKILKTLDAENILFYDIETARVVKELELDSPLFDSWAYKKRKENITDNDQLLQTYKDEAGLYPEFSRIISIVVGRISGDELITKTYDSDSEKELLETFNNDVAMFQSAKPKMMLCGFANLGFDTPFVQKRMIINGVDYQDCFDGFDKKPWILDEIDLSVLWKGSSWNKASLINVSVALGIPSPKSDMAGYEVGDVYWNDGRKGLERISKYCEQDVLAVANIFRKLRFESLLTIGEAPAQQEEEMPEFLVSIYNGGPFGMQEKIELKKKLDALDEKERDNAILILESMASKKRPRLTKAYLKELKKNYE